jgi:uncharacterized LabA/DUF88 family protein
VISSVFPFEREPPIQRAIAYIDGFNLYFGLRDSGLRRCYWLDLAKLSRNLMRAGQQIVLTKYFTARISGGTKHDAPRRRRALDAKRKRQSDYLEALGTLPDLRMYEGHYLGKPVTCYKCGSSWRTHEEKMTDVQIATELLLDAFNDRLDMALIVSADSDLVPPIRAVKRQFPRKRIVVALPPGRTSVQLRKIAHASFSVSATTLEASLLPDAVETPGGFVLRRPSEWR